MLPAFLGVVDFAMDEELEPVGLENPFASPQDISALPTSKTLTPEGLRPFLTIWFQPRATIRGIFDEAPGLYVHWLVCVLGIGHALDRASERNAGELLSLSQIIAMACVGGPLGGYISMIFFSYLTKWTGAWLGGQGDVERIKTAYAWSSVPSICALFFWIPQIYLFGMEIFTERTPTIFSSPVFWSLFAVELLLKGWSLVLFSQTVAEAQGYRSAWRGFFNIILPGVVIVVPLMMVVVVVLLFN